MKEYYVKLKDTWGHLVQREKLAVLVGGGALLLFGIYQWIWFPLMINTDRLRERIRLQAKTYAWMKQADQAIQRIEQQGQTKKMAVTPVEWLGLLQKQIDQAGLEPYLTQLKQATNEAIEIHFQKVEFDKLIRLLMTSAKMQSTRITQMSVSAENDPGMVNADITLRME